MTYFFDLSVAVSGEDGNVYLLRATPKGPIYVISPTGEVVRTLHLTPPDPNARLLEIKLAPRLIAAVFTVVDPTMVRRTKGMNTIVVQVLNAASGEPIAEYTTKDTKIGSTLVSFAREELTFFGADAKGNMQFIKTAP